MDREQAVGLFGGLDDHLIYGRFRHHGSHPLDQYSQRSDHHGQDSRVAHESRNRSTPHERQEGGVVTP